MGWWTPDRQAQAYQYLLSAGLSPYGAAGLVSRWANVESTGQGPLSVNPGRDHAFGIVQWLGPRAVPIRGNTSFEAQLAYVVQELNSSEARAANVLRSASTPEEGAIGASMYERAEHYKAASGTDQWTSRTLAGIPAVLANVGGNAVAVPQNNNTDSVDSGINFFGFPDWLNEDLGTSEPSPSTNDDSVFNTPSASGIGGVGTVLLLVAGVLVITLVVNN